jgi:hypothetical protein
MTRVEFLEKVWGPGPGEADAVYRRSGRRYRVGQVEDFTDEAFEILVRDLPEKAFRVVGEDTALRARKAETVQENQHRTLAQVDADLSASKIEQKHMRRKMTDDVQEQIGIKAPAKPKKGMDIKAMKQAIVGA